MNMLLQLLFMLTVTGSIIVVCFLFLRFLLPQTGSMKWQYTIGKLAIFFYLLPIAFLTKWIGSYYSSDEVSSTQVSGASQSIPFSISTDIALSLMSIWGIGVIIFVGWQLYCYNKFLTGLKQTCLPVPEDSEIMKQLTLIKEVLRIKEDVQIVYSSAIRSPFLIGLRKPTIYLPVENSVNLEMSMVLHHELIHLKRKDLWMKALVLGANAIHWFNPFLYLLRREIHTVSELSCDEEVVRDMTHEERKLYGATILNVMIGSRELPIQFCSSLSGDGKKLKRRLNTMIHVKKLNKPAVIISVITMLVIGIIGTSTSAWASAKAPEVTPKLEAHPASVIYNNEGKKVSEVKIVPIEEATEEEIEKHKQKLGNAEEVLLLADVEEDKVERIEEESENKLVMEEAEEVILVETESK